MNEANANGSYVIAESACYGGMPELMRKYDRYVGREAGNSQEPAPERYHEQCCNRDENILVHVDVGTKNLPPAESKPRTCDHVKSNLTMRLSDAGLRRRQTMLIYSDHRSSPWLPGAVAPRSLEPVVRHQHVREPLL